MKYKPTVHYYIPSNAQVTMRPR